MASQVFRIVHQSDSSFIVTSPSLPLLPPFTYKDPVITWIHPITQKILTISRSLTQSHTQSFLYYVRDRQLPLPPRIVKHFKCIYKRPENNKGEYQLKDNRSLSNYFKSINGMVMSLPHSYYHLVRWTKRSFKNDFN